MSYCTLPHLTPFYLLPALSYFHCKIYFPPCYALFLIFTLIISPPSILSKPFFHHLVSPHSLPASYNILNSFSTFINYDLFHVDIMAIAVLLQRYFLYFLISNLIGYSPCLTPFCLPPALDYLT